MQAANVQSMTSAVMQVAAMADAVQSLGVLASLQLPITPHAMLHTQLQPQSS